jgi:hypothetical protein
MDILGRTALSMTMERYAKALPATRRDAADRLDLVISGRLKVAEDRGQHRGQEGG